MAQAGTEMELLVRYDSESFASEIDRLEGIEQTAQAVLYGESLKEDFYHRAIEHDTLSFTPRILNAEPTFYNNEHSWNHALTYGYAVREDTHEILYWIAQW